MKLRRGHGSVARHLVVASMLFLVVAGPAMAALAESTSLAGTQWQLVRIMSMDDSEYLPEAPSAYTLVFDTEGRFSAIAGCNRATGRWISESAPGLRFSEMASTKAVCPPGSLSERYLAQFDWVRSFVLRDGHLFLATMADGSIIEFQPLQPQGRVTARLMGEPLYLTDGEELQATILSRLLEDYAAAQGLKVREADIDHYLEQMTARLKADLGEDYDSGEGLTATEKTEMTRIRREMASVMIQHRNINRALYRQYGGRLIYQQLGPEPLDAYREFLEERESVGDFEILDSALAEQFWRYFREEKIHDFMEPGSSDERRAFSE